MTDKTKPDWEKIEAEYRAGVLSIREIAGQHGVSDTAIRKRAKAHGWDRDLSERIISKADALVRTQEVRTQVRTETAVSERELIEANAQAIASVRMAHRADIRKSRDLVIKLLDQLQHETVGIELFERLGELMRDEDHKGQDKLNDLYHKVISLPSRVRAMLDLSTALKTLIGLEREAYSIGQTPEKPDSKPVLTQSALESLSIHDMEAALGIIERIKSTNAP